MKKALPKNIQTIRKRAVPVFRRYGVKRAAVFGSFARGEERKKSDVDFLVQIPRGMDLFEFSGLRQDLAARLEREVDLVTYASIHPFLKEQILNEQVVIYEKKP
ncbi:MAG: nucleotidyltransferase family protein [Candidatus Uhrbacteria bacterium]|nr:nucleotidyltransferase family protein [Candidatus Uhrbacteria bacterium]